jgi:DegV family protein with EDD domain
MQKKVVISVDSTGDLPQEYIDRYDIKVVYLFVHMGEYSAREGIDITPDDVFEYVNKTGKLPTTSAPSVDAYIKAFTQWTELGFEVVHCSLSTDLSSAFQNAQIAAREIQGVYVVDSRTLSMGLGQVSIKAAELAESGLSAREIHEYLINYMHKVSTSFVIETLKHLAISGRCSSITLLGANLLKLRPCIEMVDGKMKVVRKYRGSLTDVLQKYVVDQLSNAKNINFDRLFIAHSGVKNEIIELVKEKIEKLFDFKEIVVTRVGCAVSTHCGPNVLGLLYTTL